MTKKQKRIWNTARILILLAIVYFVIARPIRLLLIGLDGLAQQLPDTKNILPEYRNLLDSLSNTELIANYTANSRKRFSVSVGIYNKKMY